MGLFRKKTNLIYSTPPVSGRRKQYFVLVLIISSLIIMALALQLLTKHSSSDHKNADSFVQYFVNGDAANSYRLYSAEAQKADTLASWTAKVDKVKGFYSREVYKKSISISSETLNIYQATGKDGSYIFYVKVVKGSYKVSSFSATPGIYIEAAK